MKGHLYDRDMLFALWDQSQTNEDYNKANTIKKRGQRKELKWLWFAVQVFWPNTKLIHDFFLLFFLSLPLSWWVKIECRKMLTSIMSQIILIKSPEKTRPWIPFGHGANDGAPLGTNHSLSEQIWIQCPSQPSTPSKRSKTHWPRSVGSQHEYQHKREVLPFHVHPYLQD